MGKEQELRGEVEKIILKGFDGSGEQLKDEVDKIAELVKGIVADKTHNLRRNNVCW